MSGVRMVSLVRRAVESVQFGPEPLEWETVVQAVAMEQAEVFGEETAEAESCCVVFYTGEAGNERAQIALFYREGQPDGLIRDMRSLMRQMVQAFRRRNIVHVYAQVETANEHSARLMAAYRQVSGFQVNSALMHATVDGLETKLGARR